MKYLLCLLCVVCLAQTKPIIETTLIAKTPITEKSLIGIDNFNSSYFVEGNSLFKKTSDYTFNYSNIQLGTITSANTFNPLKINVFFKDFNTVVILDNRLAEIYKIDFNANKTYRSVSHISTGSDNTIWLFNQDTQQLELFDYKANRTRIFTIPTESRVLDLKSNFNYCWLITEGFLYKYNYFGSQISKIKNNGFTSASQIKEGLILQQNNKLFYLKNESSQPLEIKLPKMLIKAFFVNNETLYIYDDKLLYNYHLKTI